jgi:hypothetical protein
VAVDSLQITAETARREGGRAGARAAVLQGAVGQSEGRPPVAGLDPANGIPRNARAMTDLDRFTEAYVVLEARLQRRVPG